MALVLRGKSVRLAVTHCQLQLPTSPPLPSCSRKFSLLSRAKKIWTTLTSFRKENPRQIQERKDLSMSLLSITHRELRMESPETNMLDLIDPALKKLEQTLADSTVLGLRYELNYALTPQLLEVLETFQRVDDQLPSSEEFHIDNTYRKILCDEYAFTLNSLETATAAVSKNRPDHRVFLNRKLEALHLLLSHHGWLEEHQANALTPNNTLSSDTTPHSELDALGYNASTAEKDTNDAIRHFQALNLAKSARIRDELGHSVIALQSTVPGAGRGVFCDGNALAGSLLAFFPGVVWLKEHLAGTTAMLQSHFQHDDNFQISLRYDDILIDSRRSPYTVLDADGSNPWAIAHIVNHAPKEHAPNCRTIMINFTEPMKLKSAGLLRYVPNTYAREPMMLGPKAFDKEVVVMHGMGLIAARDVCNEELFYDYRLSPGSANDYPSWYHVVDQEALENRWHRDD